MKLDNIVIRQPSQGSEVTFVAWDNGRQKTIFTKEKEYIVRAVNCHEELVKTLEYTLSFLQKNDVQGSESVYSYIQVALKRAKGEV